MDLGVLTIETEYSDADFKIEWSGVREIYSSTVFLVSLDNGERVTSTIRSSDELQVVLVEESGNETRVPIASIVYLKQVQGEFLSRIKANVDVGYSLTKAQGQEQITVNTRLGYVAERWWLDAYYNDLFSSQDSVSDIRRTDVGTGARYLLPADWYVSVDATWLSNTEQALLLRTTLKAGAGNYIVHSNRAHLGFGAGLSTNFEEFSNSEPSRRSIEGYFGVEVNLFDFGDLTFYTSAYAYPNITDTGRWRSDVRADIKYKLPLDFYVRAGVTANYDNRPAVVGSELDYVFTTGFGWKW